MKNLGVFNMQFRGSLTLRACLLYILHMFTHRLYGKVFYGISLLITLSSLHVALYSQKMKSFTVRAKKCRHQHVCVHKYMCTRLAILHADDATGIEQVVLVYLN
jgi:hypothetical protein